MISIVPLRVVAKGFGGSATSLITRGFRELPAIVEEIRNEIFGRRPKQLIPSYANLPDVVKIRAILESVNNDPLVNPLMKAITYLIEENDLAVKTRLLGIKISESSKPAIFIERKQVKND